MLSAYAQENEQGRLELLVTNGSGSNRLMLEGKELPKGEPVAFPIHRQPSDRTLVTVTADGLMVNIWNRGQVKQVCGRQLDGYVQLTATVIHTGRVTEDASRKTTCLCGAVVTVGLDDPEPESCDSCVNRPGFGDRVEEDVTQVGIGDATEVVASTSCAVVTVRCAFCQTELVAQPGGATPRCPKCGS